MAFPTFPVNVRAIEEDEDDESSEGEDILPPAFNLDGSESGEGEESGSEEEGEGSPAITGIAQFTGLMNLKQGGAFPFPTRAPATTAPLPAAAFPAPRPAIPMPVATVPFPTAAAPAPVGLRLTVMPKVTPAPVLGPLVPAAPIPVLRPLTLPLANIPAIPTANIPIIQTTGLKLAPTPQVPVLAGVVAPTPVPLLPAQPPAKTLDVAAILAKLPGITVATVTPAPGQVQPDINDLLKKETDETPEDFEARRVLTLKLASIPDYKLNNATAVTAALIMMKKAKLGVTYDPDVEAAIAYLTELLKR
jgi:hypothetical protein